MNTNNRNRNTWSAVACALAVLALTSGAAQAAVPSTTAHHFSSHPMISGTVVTVTDHQMVVNTDQGEQVTLELDSRTMAPRDLAPGMVMRAEFLALEDCHFYAQRIMPIRSGMSTSRLQAYANTGDSHEAIARNATAYGSASSPGHARVDSRENQTQSLGEHSPGMVMTSKPTTADRHFSARPMITGRVIAVNDHLVVLDTDQGQQLGLVMDSRTMVPREVAPGSVLRAEFTQLKDGRYYAKRINQIGSGVVDREQAYAHTQDSQLVLARHMADCGSVVAASPNPMTSVIQHRESPVALASPVDERPATLPQTASKQPLILSLGLFALACAGLVMVARGRGIA